MLETTGHNPLRMHGKERKGITYYACCYRIAYGDKAAAALGHGKWQYVREDLLLSVIDRFFHQHVFGPERLGPLPPTADHTPRPSRGRDTHPKRVARAPTRRPRPSNRAPAPLDRGRSRPNPRPRTHRGAQGRTQ
jgi:hypothetical protein